jgi:hypothetical protein
MLLRLRALAIVLWRDPKKGGLRARCVRQEQAEMGFDFGTVADDFFCNINVQTTLALPTSRDTVLHFCEAVQREFGDMTSFYQRETGENVLEGSREGGSYRWVELSANTLGAGHFNPPELVEAYRLHRWLLDRSVYFLGISALDVEALDLLLGFNLDFHGNRDAIVAEALLAGSPLSALFAEEGKACLECEPTLVMALDDECYLQARLALETRSSSYQVRTGRFEDEPITIYLTVRRYARPGQKLDPKAAIMEQADLCEELASRIVVPQVILPISAAIASHGR